MAPDGTPTERYFRYLDQSQSKTVLAEGMREAYADLFQLDRRADKMSRADLKGKIKTLTQGKATDNVVDKMALTFQSLAKYADFSAAAAGTEAPGDGSAPAAATQDVDADARSDGRLPWGGLVYSIQLQLPESRDPAVYDALFKSLKTHLL